MDLSKSFWIQNCRQGHNGMCIVVSILGILIGCTLVSWAAFGPTKDHHSLRQVAIVCENNYLHTMENIK